MFNLEGMTRQAAEDTLAHFHALTESYRAEKAQNDKMRSDPHGQSGHRGTELRAVLCVLQEIEYDFQAAAEEAGLIPSCPTPAAYTQAEAVDEFMRFQRRAKDKGIELQIQRVDGICSFLAQEHTPFKPGPTGTMKTSIGRIFQSLAEVEKYLADKK